MKQPLIASAAMIINNNKILLIKRGRNQFKNCWAFPSGIGAFDKVFNPKEAVKLEVKFDLNCKFSPKFYTFVYENFGIPTITLFFVGNIKGNPKIINQEVTSEFKWFSITDALKLRLAFSHKKILKKFLENKCKLTEWK